MTFMIRKLLFTTLLVTLCASFSLHVTRGVALAKQRVSIKKVKAEGSAYNMEDEKEVRSQAISNALSQAVFSAIDTLMQGTQPTDATETVRVSVNASPLKYILDYRVLSEGWIRHLEADPDLPEPPPSLVNQTPYAQGDGNGASAGQETAGIIKERGMKLFHVWIEASVDFTQLKDDLELNLSYEGQETSLVTLVLLTVNDYGEFTSIKEKIEDLDNVKEITFDSFQKGKIVLTAEVWGNPYALLERLRARNDLGSLDIIPGGVDRITIKGVLKK